MNLLFKENEKTLTLGVEMELQVLDAPTLRLTPRAAEIIDGCKNPRLAPEMFQSTLELITTVCENAHEACAQLRDIIEDVQKYARNNDMRFAGTGTHPVADYNERILSESPRYHRLIDRNQWLIRRMAVYGLHIHIGMANGDECIRYNNFFLYLLPHLMALSSSSSFWKGQDTGLASSRPTTYESHPTSGLPYLVKDWKGYNDIYSALMSTGSIESIKDIWWDLRPSPNFGTLEMRMCDGPATLCEIEAITAFVHSLALWFQDNQEEFFSRNKFVPERWIMRENKWRAIRYGLSGEIINQDTMKSISLKEDIYRWLDLLHPYFERYRYSNQYNLLIDICKKGSSADRQRAVMDKYNDIEKVIEHNVLEFEKQAPIWLS